MGSEMCIRDRGIICVGKSDIIEKFIEEMRVVKEPIRIYNIQTKYSEPTGEYKQFIIVTGSINEEIMEGFSSWFMHLDNMNGTTNKMNGKLDSMNGKLDNIVSNTGKMLTKQDEIVNAIQASTSEIRNMTNQRIQRLEDNARTHS